MENIAPPADWNLSAIYWRRVGSDMRLLSVWNQKLRGLKSTEFLKKKKLKL
jgi:hypothetical protein